MSLRQRRSGEGGTLVKSIKTANLRGGDGTCVSSLFGIYVSSLITFRCETSVAMGGQIASDYVVHSAIAKTVASFLSRA